MTSPFLDASLPDLKAMVQNGDLTDAELDALTTKYCFGVEIYFDDERKIFVTALAPFRMSKSTSDGREAIRLMVKYRLNFLWSREVRDSSKVSICVLRGLNPCSPIMVRDHLRDTTDVLREAYRAITEAAVVCALTLMIEGE